MGYFSGIGDMLGAAADAKKRQAKLQPPPFQGGPPGSVRDSLPPIAIADDGDTDNRDALMPTRGMSGGGAPLGGIPGAPSEVPPGITMSGLRAMVGGGAGAARPMGGYYAPATNLDSLGGGLAQALDEVRRNARSRVRGGGR